MEKNDKRKNKKWKRIGNSRLSLTMLRNRKIICNTTKMPCHGHIYAYIAHTY